MSIIDIPQQDHMQPPRCYYSAFPSATRTQVDQLLSSISQSMINLSLCTFLTILPQPLQWPSDTP